MTDTLTEVERLYDEVLAAQRAKGRAKYGKGLDHTEPRDWLRMALEEDCGHICAESIADSLQPHRAESRRSLHC